MLSSRQLLPAAATVTAADLASRTRQENARGVRRCGRFFDATAASQQGLTGTIVTPPITSRVPTSECTSHPIRIAVVGFFSGSAPSPGSGSRARPG